MTRRPITSVGYHFTSLKNWASIRRSGLKPYYLWASHPEIGQMLEHQRGIFIFTVPCINRQDELGCVLYQYATKRNPEVVQIAVEYYPDDLVADNGDGVDIGHDGIIGELEYHHQKPATVLFHRIPPDRLKLVRQYHAGDILRYAEPPVLTS